MNIRKNYRIFLMLTCLTLLLPLTIGSIKADPTRQTETDFAAIDAYVTEQVNNLGIPGLALGIVQDGEIAYLQGFGVADSSGRAVTPQTPFYLGSVTKSFTALAVMQLVEAGKIELDAPVQTYLPWFELADKEASAKITVRHLLNHTTGISTKDGMRDRTSQQGLEETVRDLDKLQLTRPVGTTYQYSNLNYNIAGLIVEQVSGQSYADYVTEHIFEPLDMRHSFASGTPALADGFAEGHLYMFRRAFRYEGAVAPAQIPSGYLIASAEDLTHYVLAQMNEGRYGDTAVLSPQGMAELHTPAIPAEGDRHYAMGWFTGTWEGNPYIEHGGTLPDFLSKIILLPETGTGIVLLTNASGFEQRNQVNDLAVGVLNLLNSRPVAPVSLPSLLTILYWITLLTPLLQILGIYLVWRKRQSIKVWGVVLIVVLNLAVVAFLFKSSLAQLALPTMLVFHPDLGYSLIVIAALGIGWSAIYTVMNLRARKVR